MTPLMYAASDTNDSDIVEMLIKAGADVNGVDSNGKTPLMYAVSNAKTVDCVYSLLEAGANPKARDVYNRCAVDYIDEGNPLYGTNIYWRLWDASF